MNRILALLSALALMISATGCCCHHLCGGGGACPPPCDPCAPGYGGAPGFSQVYAPAYTTAAIPTTGFVTASAAPACDNCAPSVPPY